MRILVHPSFVRQKCLKRETQNLYSKKPNQTTADEKRQNFRQYAISKNNKITEIAENFQTFFFKLQKRCLDSILAEKVILEANDQNSEK